MELEGGGVNGHCLDLHLYALEKEGVGPVGAAAHHGDVRQLVAPFLERHEYDAGAQVEGLAENLVRSLGVAGAHCPAAREGVELPAAQDCQGVVGGL